MAVDHSIVLSCIVLIDRAIYVDISNCFFRPEYNCLNTTYFMIDASLLNSIYGMVWYGIN